MQLIKIDNGYVISVNDSYKHNEAEIIVSGTIENLKKVVYDLIITTTLDTHSAIERVTNNFIPKDKVALIKVNKNEYKIIITYGMAFGVSTKKTAWTGGLLKIVKYLEDKITT